MILQGALQIVVKREPCLTMVASRHDDFGDAVERTLDAFDRDRPSRW